MIITRSIFTCRRTIATTTSTRISNQRLQVLSNEDAFNEIKLPYIGNLVHASFIRERLVVLDWNGELDTYTIEKNI